MTGCSCVCRNINLTTRVSLRCSRLPLPRIWSLRVNVAAPEPVRAAGGDSDDEYIDADEALDAELERPITDAAVDALVASKALDRFMDDRYAGWQGGRDGLLALRERDGQCPIQCVRACCGSAEKRCMPPRRCWRR